MTDSPPAQWLHTNLVPSDAECQKIRTDVSQRVVRLESVNKRLRELDAERDQLTAERDELETYVDSHKALVAYPRRLPPDVIREIFVACLPTDRNAVMSAQEAPLLLARISSAWRHIALTTPRLWSSLHIPVEFVLEKPEQRIPAVSLWLQRSGVRPISLSLSFTSECEGLDALLDCLAESAARWRNIEVWDAPREVAQRFAGMLRHSIPVPIALQQLGIYRNEYMPWVADWIMPGPAFEAPEVDSFLLRPFFCAQFTHLSLESAGPSNGIALSDVLNLLGQCPRLISFAFVPLDSGPQDPINIGDQYSASKPLAVLSLKSFSIIHPRYLTLKSVGHLLNHLDLPALRQLHVPTTSLVDGDGAGHLSCISTQLETLHINLPSFTETGVQQTLGHFLNLTELSVSNNADDWIWAEPIHLVLDEEACTPQWLLRLLTPARGGTAVCPRLQRLEIRGNSHVSGGTICSFLRGRIQLGSGFRRLAIDWSKDWGRPPVSTTEYEAFRSRGVKVNFLVLSQNNRPTFLCESHPWMGLPSLGMRTSWEAGEWIGAFESY
ncbi:hypothetical protein FB45DRAFT_890683 [Roridomyces roridus]|uniref:F-box domain-containing protein n=1 Tax=Roridomyces roridus TaxID=1738132 RepID=A0AAD7CDM9_9AGAR|nr:hypothetical protein FB45DRAFT_890683 [Roridomyces roridus]